MVKPAKPLAAYMRVSRVGDREDKLRSPDFQRQAIARYAEGERFAVEWFDAELDVSGSKAKRPVLDAIISRVKAGELGGVVVAKLDRLSRMRPRDRVLLFEEIEDAGGVVLSAGEQLDPSTPEGRFARDVFLGVARLQWEKYREGFERAKAGAIEHGIAVNTRAAVGYRKRDGDRQDRCLEPDPDVAPLVREVFERRAQGEGPSALGQFLKSRGVLTSQGSRTWSKQAIYNLIGNRVYLGELRYGLDDRYVKAGAHEAIVDIATWTAAQHPNGRRITPSRSEGSAWLLTGILRCAECRYALQGTTTSRGKRIYRCTRTHSAGVCPAPARIDADTVETAAVKAFWDLTADLEAHGTPDTSGTLAARDEALQRAETALSQWMAPEVQEAIGDLGEYAAGLRERRAARDDAAEALGAARAAAGASAAMPSTDTLRGAWERMTTVQRRELLGLRFDCLALRRDPRALVVYPAGTGPRDLPRRGFKQSPVLAPFPTTDVARRLAV
jgi:DNA invertase Pin-like site-specific DNA recombinase